MDIKPVYNFLRHPIRNSLSYIFNRSGYYQEVIDNHYNLIDQYVERAADFHLKREETLIKDRKIKDLERITNSYKALIIENVLFHKQNQALLERDRKVQKTVDLLTGLKEDLTVFSKEQGFVEQRREILEGLSGIIHKSKKTDDENRALKTQIVENRASEYSNFIKTTLGCSTEFQQIPFIYYDFVQNKVHYTHALTKICQLDKQSGEKISLKYLFSKLNKEDLKGENGIINSLRKGIPLNNYPVHVTNKKGKLNIFYLDSIPVSYKPSFNHNRSVPLGVSIMVYYPNGFFTRRMNKLTRGLENSLKTIFLEPGNNK